MRIEVNRLQLPVCRKHQDFNLSLFFEGLTIPQISKYAIQHEKGLYAI